jgi:hypothetical protein
MPDSFLLTDLLTNFSHTKQRFGFLGSKYRQAQDNKIASKTTENKAVLKFARKGAVVKSDS